MRLMVRTTIPTEPFNAVLRSGNVGELFQQMMDQLKPEAAYFYLENGLRTNLFILNVADASQIPGLIEPFYLGFNAQIDITPVLTPEDMGKALPDVEAAVQMFPGA
jgi:hypothetical protein